MARIRIFIVLALAVVAGGTFAYGTYNYVQNVPAESAARRRTDPSVIVAATDLELGAELRPTTCAASSGRPTRCPRARSGSPTSSSAAA